MRPDVYPYFMQIAHVVATRATCPRRQVGCVLINARRHILATGYNGVPAGQKHCIDQFCPGATAPSGQGLDLCEAIHAEQNALLQCRDVHDIDVCFVTTAPCITCTKLLLNTSCKTIVYVNEYPHSFTAAVRWRDAGRMWLQLKSYNAT
jgi:dCMP deaminase